jgi:hypothetical protein
VSETTIELANHPKFVLPAEYKATWDAMLAGIPGAKRQGVEEVTAFWPMIGKRYAGELMVVGQATNGWINTTWVDYLRSARVRAELIAEAETNSSNDGERCRTLWVLDAWGATEGYNTKKSPFWTALNELIPRLLGAGVDRSVWPSYLAWSNLYKIAPQAKNRPVPSPLQNAQRVGAIELLRQELDTYAPRRVLATTSYWIKGFTGPLGLELTWIDQLVLAYGTDAASRRWVVAAHPRGKKRREWVTDVLDAFELADTNR